MLRIEIGEIKAQREYTARAHTLVFKESGKRLWRSIVDAEDQVEVEPGNFSHYKSHNNNNKWLKLACYCTPAAFHILCHRLSKHSFSNLPGQILLLTQDHILTSVQKGNLLIRLTLESSFCDPSCLSKQLSDFDWICFA